MILCRDIAEACLQTMSNETSTVWAFLASDSGLSHINPHCWWLIKCKGENKGTKEECACFTQEPHAPNILKIATKSCRPGNSFSNKTGGSRSFAKHCSQTSVSHQYNKNEKKYNLQSLPRGLDCILEEALISCIISASGPWLKAAECDEEEIVWWTWNCLQCLSRQCLKFYHLEQMNPRKIGVRGI